MGYVAVTRIKVDGEEDGTHEYIEPGEEVDLDEDIMDELIASGSVIDEDDLEDDEDDEDEVVNQASGTPSNLGQVEGTSLAPDSTGVGSTEDADDDEDDQS
jgi:hypothetical protein